MGAFFMANYKHVELGLRSCVIFRSYKKQMPRQDDKSRDLLEEMPVG